MNEPHSGNEPEPKDFSVDKEINERVVIKCPNCSDMSAVLKGWQLIEGDLENYHVVHTEVYEVLECETCKYTWQKFTFL